MPVPARRKGLGVSDEEVRRVTDALDAVDRIEDPEERVRARNEVLAEQLKRSRTWQQERRELVLAMRADKITYREIGERLGLAISTVQGIVEGYRGSGKTRPKKDASEG
jgi:DNA-directed RNA polymerase specialized sigma24 family protein